MGIKKHIVVITGPTGVGKSALAERLAAVSPLPLEIVNADMGQMYEPLSIGTAKPDLAQATVPHHLFDILKEPCSYTVIAYRKAVQQLIQEIWGRNALPVIVGGSSFYIQSLFFPPIQEEGIPSLPVNGGYATEDLWDALHAIDPDRAAEINKHDSYRLERALAIWHATGKKPSLLKPVYDPIAPFTFVYVSRDRHDLYQRINERVGIMLDEGWLNEVASLMGTPWEPFIQEKKIIGYPDIIEYYQSEARDRLALIERIAQKTRHYAKRQETFWRRLQRMIHDALNQEQSVSSRLLPVNLTTTELDLYIKQLLDTITSIEKK